MLLKRQYRLRAVAPLLAAAFWAASCAVPMGPGYTIQRQGVAIAFVPGAEPRIEVQADYRLRNTGRQPLDGLDVRLPRGSVVRLQGISARWDGQLGIFQREQDTDGDILHFKVDQPWRVKRTHTLHLEYSIVRGEPGTSQLDLASDSFYLAPNGWLAVPVPTPGLFGTGGSPPKEWVLSARVPGDFLVHASGELGRQKKRTDRGAIEFRQEHPHFAPYIVAGRYSELEYPGSPGSVRIWTKHKFEKADAETLAGAVHKIAQTYEAMFGPRDKTARSIWIVDSPVPSRLFGASGPIGMGEAISFPAALPDVALFPLSADGSAVFSREETVAYIAESLAETWTGIGSNPGYEGQLEPLRTLPLYAAHIALENLQGASARTQTIRQSLEAYDFLEANLPATKREGSRKELGIFTDGFAFPPKTLLFYFALEDQFGREKLHRALGYMVQTRKGRGYNLNALIAALEGETRQQNVAEFVRLWRKHRGIPDEFRARYASSAAPAAASSEETKP